MSLLWREAVKPTSPPCITLPYRVPGTIATLSSFSGPSTLNLPVTTAFWAIAFLLGNTKLTRIIKGKRQLAADSPLRSAADLPAAQAAVRFLDVGVDWEGQRLDNFLFREVKGVPKSHIYRLIRSGQVRINKGRAQADSRLQAGDVVRVPPVRSAEAGVVGSAQGDSGGGACVAVVPGRDFPVLFEDDCLIALNKPAGVAVHGGSGVSFGVIEQLRKARPHAPYLELVHRLDRETSGILLVAKKRSALVHLQNQFRMRETGKTYLALVKGVWPANLKVVDTPLRKYLLPDGERRVRPAAKDDPEGMRAVSLFRVQQSWPARPRHGMPATSLVAVTIKTGRTHQIRVHTASSGYPIAGDDKYGDFDWNRRLLKQGVARMFLHAWRLAFDHPADGRRIALECPPGDDLQQVLAHWDGQWLNDCG